MFPIIKYFPAKIWKEKENKVGFGFFYGILTIVGYLMPNVVYSNILDIYDL